MKNKKGFERKPGILVVSFHDMDQEFQNLFQQRDDENRHHGYNRYWSEFNPDGKEDYSHTFTMVNVEQYWQDQTKNNHYKGTLEEFIKEYGLEMDIWFIKCGYDFTGVKEILIDY